MGGFIFFLFIVPLVVSIFMVVIKFHETDKFSLKPALPWVVASIPLLLLSLSFVQVDAGTMGVVTRYGRVNRSLPPGAHLIIPFAESVHELSTQTLVVKPSEDAASHDLQIVHMEITLAYHLDPGYVGFIYTQLSDASSNAVENKVVIPAVLEAMKSRTAQYDAQQLIGERPRVRDGIEEFLKDKLSAYHIVPETVSITEFNFSKDYNDAIEAKVTAQQKSEKAQNDLWGSTRSRVSRQLATAPTVTW